MFFPRSLSAALAILVVAAPAAAQARSTASPLEVEVLSNRDDLVPAGDALVAVDYSKRVDPASIRMELGKADITGEFGPGIDQRGAIPWQTYQDAKGNVIYGGRPLGAAPRSHAVAPRRSRARAS
jgi:hypothetical protein